MQLMAMNLVHWAGAAGWTASVLQNAAAGFATSLWQSAAIACTLWLGLKLAPRMTAAHRFAAWAAGFAAAVGLTVLSLITHLNAGAGEVGFASGVTAATAKPWLELDARLSLAIGCLWVAAVILRASDLAVHSMRLRRLWKHATPIAPTDAEIAALSDSGKRRFQICTTDALDRPGVIGFFAPRILIPEWLYARLTRGELEQIVLHESEHLRRGDDWTNLLQKLCLIAFPLNPALWWMERQLCREREMACDEGVVRITRAPRAYASCLASIAERGLERRFGARAEALSLGAWERRSELVGRVQGILTRRHALSPMAAAGTLGALGCGLAFGSVELARCPQLVAFVPAQKTEGAMAASNRVVPTDRAEMNRGTGKLAPGFYAIPAKAILPVYGTVRTRQTVPHRSVRKAAAPSALAVAANNVPTPSQPTMTAKATNVQDGTVIEQEWIVLTAWEQVQTPSSKAAASTTDQSAGLSGDSAARDNSEPGNGKTAAAHGANTFRVTRLILRILPAEKGTALPGAKPVGGGWFVIQL